jgi:hypothetical protein
VIKSDYDRLKLLSGVLSMRLLCSVIFLLSFASVGQAKPIKFTHTGSGIVTLDDVQLRNEPISFVITAYGDTINRSSDTVLHLISHDRAEIELDGFGMIQFTSPTHTWVHSAIPGLLGFGRPYDGNLFDASGNDAFLGWDMLTSFGPYAGPHSLTQWVPSPFRSPVTTDHGVLILLQPQGFPELPGTFTAVVTPEPSSIVFAAASCLLLLLRRM